MKKNYMLDTNILLQDPSTIYGFDDNDIYISITTLNELDSKKNASGDLGYNARETLRNIREICDNQNIIRDNACLHIVDSTARHPSMNVLYDLIIPDHRIINNALWNDCILITNDTAMYLKAKTIGLLAQSYHNTEVKNEYLGRRQINFGESIPDDLVPNEFVLDFNSGSKLYMFKDNELVQIKDEQYKTNYCVPRNIGQRMSLIALLSDIPLAIIKGRAGSAKTFLSLAAGLTGLYKEDGYDKILITRTNTLSDADLGFLPGTLEEKMSPLIAPFMDNLESLLRGEEKDQVKYVIDDMFDTGMIEIVSMAYMRGRSITNSFIIVDEAQNATPNQILEIVTRAGIGSKVVLLGDPDQIDNNKLSKRNNGLVYASEKMKGSPYCVQVTLSSSETVRSELATDASERLKIR